MTINSITVDIVVVPRQVNLVEENVYLYRHGQLLDCGTLECILEYLREGEADGVSMRLSAARDHFDDDYVAKDGPHVVRSENPS